MSIDATKVIFASTLNAYKNTGVKSGTVSVSGTVAAGAEATFDGTVTLDAEAKFFTILVETTGGAFLPGSVRWQSLPSALYYEVGASGPASSLTLLLTLVVSGNNLTLRAYTLNPYGSTITLNSTTINFKYVPYTIAN